MKLEIEWEESSKLGVGNFWPTSQIWPKKLHPFGSPGPFHQSMPNAISPFAICGGRYAAGKDMTPQEQPGG